MAQASPDIQELTESVNTLAGSPIEGESLIGMELVACSKQYRRYSGTAFEHEANLRATPAGLHNYGLALCRIALEASENSTDQIELTPIKIGSYINLPTEVKVEATKEIQEPKSTPSYRSLGFWITILFGLLFLLGLWQRLVR